MIHKKKITLVVIGADPSHQKSMEFSRKSVYALVTLLILALIAILTSYIYLVPKAVEYNTLTTEISRLAGNSTQLVEVLEDFRKMQNFNRYVRNMLGIRQVTLNDSEAMYFNEADSLSLAETEPASGSQIVVLENIPNTMPVNGVITQDFDVSHPLSEDNHYGIDVAARERSAVNAAASGLVVYSGWDDVYGNIVILAHGEKYITVYAHNSVNLVKTRDRVRRGQRIALLGSTGRSTGPHLHFEVWNDGIPENPVDYISEYKLE